MNLLYNIFMDDFSKIVEAAKKSLENPGTSPSPLPKQESNEFSTIYVFRHSETDDNFNRIFSGRRDSKLTPRGIEQAKTLAFKLKDKHFDLAYSSPLSRCRDTLSEVLKYHPDVHTILEPLLLERDYGVLTGKSKVQLMKEDFELAVKYRRGYDFPLPGGESLKDVQEKRVYPFCKRLTQELKNVKKNIVICCTNNTMRIIRMFFEKLTIEEMQTLENPFDDFASYVVGEK